MSMSCTMKTGNLSFSHDRKWKGFRLKPSLTEEMSANNSAVQLMTDGSSAPREEGLGNELCSSGIWSAKRYADKFGCSYGAPITPLKCHPNVTWHFPRQGSNEDTRTWHFEDMVLLAPAPALAWNSWSSDIEVESWISPSAWYLFWVSLRWLNVPCRRTRASGQCSEVGRCLHQELPEIQYCSWLGKCRCWNET